MMNKYKTLEELKEELGDKFEEYMYKANIELLTKIDRARSILCDADSFIMKKEYVKGRACVVVNPAITEFNRTTDSANKTVQTLIKILKGFKSSDSENTKDQLLAIINGEGDEE